MIKHLPFLLFAVVLAAGGGYLGYVLRVPDSGQVASLPQSVHITQELGGTFTMTRHDGTVVTEEDFHGKYALIYFGYSFCPDVCSTSLVEMLRALRSIPQEQQEKVTPIFITVDPERDTLEEITDYVTDFDPELIGLTGTVAQVEAIKKLYKVYSQKSGSDEDIQEMTYLVDHSSFFYLMNPDGSFAQMFSGQISPQNFHNNLQKVIQS